MEYAANGFSAQIGKKLDNLKQPLVFTWKTLTAAPHALRHRHDTLNQMHIMGVQALPLVLLAVVCISMVLSLEWGKKLELFGAKIMLGRLIGVSVLREIGPTIAGLMLAGRTSAKLVSEIGNMVLTEQIDALRAAGTDPLKRLIVPRVFASILVMLPIVVIADAAGIIAGWWASVTWQGIDPEFFWLSMNSGLLMKDLIIGAVKPPVYGLVIGLIGAYYGYTVKNGAVGLGKAATKAVMLASLGVLITDLILTRTILMMY